MQYEEDCYPIFNIAYQLKKREQFLIGSNSHLLQFSEASEKD